MLQYIGRKSLTFEYLKENEQYFITTLASIVFLAEVYNLTMKMNIYVPDNFKLTDVETNFIKRGTRYPLNNLV